MTDDRQPTTDGPPAPPELLRHVRRLELRTRRLVNTRFTGEYHSVFKGQGIEFAEVREYLPGDDVRTIDWNVTARLGQPYVKKFVEERELSVLLAVDLSGSERWGTRRRFKRELVAEVAAVIALSAARNNDRVGLLTFTDRIERVLPPRKGRRHALRVLRDLLAGEPASRGTDAAAALAYATRALSTRSVIFLCSDFQLGEGWPRFEQALTHAAHAHDVVAIRVSDPAEAALPSMGLMRLRDPETGALSVVNTSSSAARQRFAAAADADRARGDRLFRRLGVDVIDLSTDAPYTRELLGFFRRRERRARR